MGDETGKINLEEVQAQGLEVVKKVNAVLATGKYGVEEIRDVAKAYYQACQSLAAGGGQVIPIILAMVFPLTAAYTGYESIPSEASDLGDDEIASVVAEGDKFSLGENAPKYKQGLKQLLVTVQTYFVFRS